MPPKGQRLRVTLVCMICKHDFESFPCHVKRRKCCSNECSVILKMRSESWMEKISNERKSRKNWSARCKERANRPELVEAARAVRARQKEDPVLESKRLESVRMAMASVEVRQKIKERTTEEVKRQRVATWQKNGGRRQLLSSLLNPEIRKASLRKANETRSSKNWRENQSLKLKAAWADPDKRRIFLEAQASDEVKTKKAIAIKKALSDPIVREKLRKAASLKMASPEAREKCRQQMLKTAVRFTSKLEVKFEGLLKGAGIAGFERNKAIGSFIVDVVFPEKKLAVEVDGCYWHGCGTCNLRKNLRIEKKIRADKVQPSILKALGWKLVRFWEHEINNDPEDVVSRMRSYLS